MPQYPLNQQAEIWLPRQIMAVAGDIDTGKDNFRNASVDKYLNMLDNLASGDRSAVTPAIWYDAECAAVIAACLHLHKGPGVARKGGREVRRGFTNRHDVADTDFRAIDRKQGRGLLFNIADHGVYFGHGFECLRFDLCSATGDNDPRVRTTLSCLANGLTGMADRLIRNRATVYNDEVARIAQLLSQSMAFCQV